MTIRRLTGLGRCAGPVCSSRQRRASYGSDTAAEEGLDSSHGRIGSPSRKGCASTVTSHFSGDGPGFTVRLNAPRRSTGKHTRRHTRSAIPITTGRTKGLPRRSTKEPFGVPSYANCARNTGRSKDTIPITPGPFSSIGFVPDVMLQYIEKATKAVPYRAKGVANSPKTRQSTRVLFASKV